MLNLLRRFSGAYRRYFIIGPLAKLVEACFDLITPLVVASMIDNGVGARDMDSVVRHGLVLVAMAVVGISVTLICQKVAALTSQGMGTDMRRELYAHINRLSFADLDRFGTPSLITRITNDVNQVQLAIAMTIRMLIRWPFLAVGSMAAALLIDVRLGLIFLVTTPLIAVVFWLVMAKSVPYFKSMQAKLDHVGLVQREGLSGVRVIRAFSREQHERERFAAAAADQAQTAIAVGKLSSVLNPVTFLVMNLGVCAILWSGGAAVNVGDLTQGQVIAFVNYMTQTLLSIVYVANMVVIFTKASASASRINQVLACEPSITDTGSAPVALPVCALEAAAVPALRFDHVGFRYGSASADALDDITLQLPVGGTLGIIGGTGSGKSTLVSLLPRLYDVARGGVEVFGADVRAWPLHQLRGVIGMVPQTAQLVSGTVRSNLCWRKANADDRELWRALEVAQAADFVRVLEAGLDAPVEAGGKNFSGGQRQRLTIARALVGDPKILVLDDSSSALDLQTDARLRRALRELAASSAKDPRPDAPVPLTTVIVSQRVSSVRDADLICVMRRGCAVGLGTHAQLLSTCDVYREICESQLEREEVA
ncbi:ABC transporter ATP-binding protein [Collinsella tanakaei]|uniref:ABC transporter ATP-binding protein n=1 Tax=Collinsella tanakaei TaxID=626935 RepID=UPI00241EB618|nr:ABC transporter ATP-binding protein [Collinsella tanakaei]